MLSLVAVSTSAAAPGPNPKSMVLRAADVRTAQSGLISNNGSTDPTDNRQPGWVSTWRVYWGDRPAADRGIQRLDDWAETYSSVVGSKSWLASKKSAFKPLLYWHPLSTGAAIGDASFAYTTTVPTPIIKQTCVDVYWRYRVAVGNIAACGKPNTFAPDSVIRLARLQQAHMQAAFS